MSWACIQLGSREHYAIPEALHGKGALRGLITDAWLTARKARLVRPWLPSLAARRSDGIPDGFVRRRTLGRLAFDARMKVVRAGAWDTVLRRNEWFGRWAADTAACLDAEVLFSYSYTARHAFRSASLKVLGQIDPGPREQDVVAAATQSYSDLAPPESAPPGEYWRLWWEEVAMADKVVVNSAWSASLLAEAGVPIGKMVEIPLVYTRAEPAVASSQSPDFSMSAFQNFSISHSRPRLQALFLGSIILRKGVGQLFDAIRQLRSEPVDFTFAGPVGVRVPEDICAMPNVRFLGPVDRATAERLYGESDLFLFPTLSDGFGLTQLEALGHGLPVIASTNCGLVVEHGVSGLVLEGVTPEAIAEAIMSLVRDRDLLSQLKAGAHVPDKFHPRHLAPSLLALEKM